MYCLFVTLAVACVAVNAWNDVPHAYPDHVRAHAHDHDLCPDVPDPMTDSALALRNSVWTKALRRLLQQLALAISVVVRSGCCCIRESERERIHVYFLSIYSNNATFTCHLCNDPEPVARAHDYVNVPGS